MEDFTVLLVFTAILIPSISSVDIVQPNGEICGTDVTFTCRVNGAGLGWRYGGPTGAPELYSASDGITTDLRLLGSGPFSTRVTNVTGGVITSIATASNLTSDVEGMTLECSNGLFNPDNEKDIVTLTLDPPASSSNATFENSTHIKFSWIGTSCVQSYRIFVNNELIDTVNGTIFFYAPQSPDDYIFQVTSIDYFGKNIGCNSAVYFWQRPKNAYFLIDSNSSGLIFTIKDDTGFNRPPVTFCNVTLNNMEANCEFDKPVFFNVPLEGSYTYNVTVLNDVGTVFRTGDLYFIMPTEAILTTTLDEVICTSPMMSDEMSPSMSPTNESATSNKLSVDPAVFAIPFIVLGVLIILSVCWIVLRICWKRQCCCPRIWRSSFWLIFFCYDCCTYDPEEKDGNTIGLKNPNAGGGDTSL